MQPLVVITESVKFGHEFVLISVIEREVEIVWLRVVFPEPEVHLNCHCVTGVHVWRSQAAVSVGLGRGQSRMLCADVEVPSRSLVDPLVRDIRIVFKVVCKKRNPGYLVNYETLIRRIFRRRGAVVNNDLDLAFVLRYVRHRPHIRSGMVESRGDLVRVCLSVVCRTVQVDGGNFGFAVCYPFDLLLLSRRQVLAAVGGKQFNERH